MTAEAPAAPPERRHLPAACVVCLFAAAGLASAGAGDVVFSEWTAVAGLAAGLAAWATFRPRAWPVWSALLGLWLWPVAILAWLAVQVALGGRTGMVLQLAIGVAVGAAIGAAVVLIGRPWRRGEIVRRCVVALLAASLAVAAALYWLLTGPPDLATYPRGATPYRLPYPVGKTFLCVQGNRAVVSHRGPHEVYSYDFAMPLRANICASRGGQVQWVEDRHDGNGLGKPNNGIIIDHGDGTHGWYLHLLKGGSFVKVGDRVSRGQVIAACGNVGTSMLPHVHFDVTDGQGRSLPVTFDDVPGDGVPRMFRRYTSGNEPE